MWKRSPLRFLNNSEKTALNILIVGGSLGAVVLNEKVPQALQIVKLQKKAPLTKEALGRSEHSKEMDG